MIWPADRHRAGAAEESALHRMASAFGEGLQRTAYDHRPAEEGVVLEKVGTKWNVRNSSGRLRRQVRDASGQSWTPNVDWVTLERWGTEWVIVGGATTAASSSMLPGG